MALDRPLAVWIAAQFLKEVGPLDYYGLTPAQHTLLETVWQGLYPATPYPCSSRSCPGRIRDAHRQVLAELQYFYSLNPTLEPLSLDIANPQNLTTMELNKTAPTPAAPRYSFAKGVDEVREFGNPIAHTALTDELAARLLAISPDYSRLFVDAEAVAAEAATTEEPLPIDLNQGKAGVQDTLPTTSAVKQMNKAEVTAQYLQELAADVVPEELNTNALVAAAIIAHRETLAE